MRTYFAIQGQTIHRQGFMNCLDWAAKQSEQSSKPIQILTARSGEPSAKIIAEVTPGKIRYLTGGRTISVKSLRNGY